MTRLLIDPATDFDDPATVTLSATLLDPTPALVRTFEGITATTVVDLPAPAAAEAWRLTVRRPHTTVNRLGFTSTDPGPIVAERTVHFAGTAPIAWAALTDVDPATLRTTAVPGPAWDAAIAELRAEVDALPTSGGGGGGFSGAYADLTGKPTIPATPGDIGAEPVGTTDARIAALIDGAPEALNTLKELAAQLATDEATAAGLAAAVAGKATLADIDAAIQAFKPFTAHSNRLVYLGDSITNFNAVVNDSGTSSHQNSRGFGHWLQVLSRQAFHVTGCFAYSGGTVAQLRAQLPNALAVAPRYLFLLAGVNSVEGGASVASIVSDFQGIYDACAAAGVTVIHGTMWPSPGQLSTPARLAVVDAVNAWIVQQGASTPGVVVVPWHVAMIDPAIGGARTNYTEDGVHPSSLGAAVLGRYAWNVLQPALGIAGSESLAYYNGDTSNLVTNPMFTGTGGNNDNSPTPNIAANWNATTVGNIFASFSKVPAADGLGDWQQIQVQGGAGTDADYIDLWNLSATIPASGGFVNQADVVFGQIEFETDADFVNASKLELHVYDPSTVNKATALQAGDSSDTRRLGSMSGIIRTPPMTPGHSQVQMHLRVGGLTGGRSVTIRVRRASIKKLVTTDGLV